MPLPDPAGFPAYLQRDLDRLNTQGVQAISASNNVFTAGMVRVTGGAGITAATDSLGIALSAASGATATGNFGGVAASNTTYTSGTVNFSGSNIVTVRSTTGQGVIIDASQSVQPVGSASATGNTTGTLAAIPLSGNLGIAGGPNITISQSTGAASTNLSISAAAVGFLAIEKWQMN